ncbi:MAG: tRNA 2-thiouridine(34) synthase MnmA [Acidimicrobiaceae bacterium]|nr:tRNA 2-thiouridine(34) synthase MnmA [Acidimicrobiaceae bacterium]
MAAKTRTKRVLVAMSGGVDSSVAAARLLDAGYEIAGVTMKLWGGPSDTGCCSVSDVDDARWAADELGIEHHVFNFGDDFERHVVAPYAADHAAGLTPNPCVECNRHIKFDRLLHRAEALGFDLVATGHHARIVSTAAGLRLRRGADTGKDQSYVLHMLGPEVLARLLLPAGETTKQQVRREAEERGLVTANKPDSQEVCFITTAQGRRRFLSQRIPMRPGRVVDTSGAQVGSVESLELLTVGQRRGLGALGGGSPRYVLDVDAQSATVTVGSLAELDCQATPLTGWRWMDQPVSGEVLVQTSAHGVAAAATIDADGEQVRWIEPRRRVAPGQAVVAYQDDIVIGGGAAAMVAGSYS